MKPNGTNTGLTEKFSKVLNKKCLKIENNIIILIYLMISLIQKNSVLISNWTAKFDLIDTA